MSATTSTLSFAIIGAGRIGSAYAYFLARAGHQVTVVARPGSKRLEQLRRAGGIVTTEGERAGVTVADHLDEQQPYDVVIVTTLAHQVDAVLPVLQRSAARQIHFMFVTPQYQRLSAVVGEKRATFGMASVLSVIEADGRAKLDVQKTKSRQGDPRLVEVFTAAGLPSQLQPEAGQWLRSQVPATIAMESVAGTGTQHPKGATWAEARTGARGMQAGFAILAELAKAGHPVGKSPFSSIPGPMLTFLLRTLSRGKFRETVGNSDEEVRGLIDLLAGEARQQRSLRQQTDALLALRPADRAKVNA